MSPARGWLLVTLLAGGGYLGAYLSRGWFPHDEGALGQTAERVLQGEVPHRDFDEPYTGLLTYLHAAAFEAGGVRLPVLRVPLLIAALFAMAACFRIAARFLPPAVAGAVTLVALAWSVPNYPASMPSWYNLFCALFGVLALIRWEESRAARWLLLAGLAGGISFLFKLSGLFYVAGALLFLVFATRQERDHTSARDPLTPAVAAAVTAGLGVFVLLLWRAVAPYYWPRVIYHFVAPGTVLAAAIASREWAAPPEPGRARLGRLARAGVPFLAGVALPVGIFVAGFALAGAVPALLHGVFVAPFQRIEYANMRPPAPYWALAATPLVILLRPRADWADPKWRRAALVVAPLLAAVLWLAAQDSFPHRFVWQSLRSLIPLVAAAAALLVALPSLAAEWAPGRRNAFVLLGSVAACASLIQFPFSSPTYFLYVFPLLMLGLVTLLEGIGRTPRPLAAITLTFYAAFAVLLVTPGATFGMAFRYEREHSMVRLDLPRAGLVVKPEDAALYTALIPKVQQHAGGAGGVGMNAVWAGPDAPEVYFLSGVRNRSRAIFDFLGAGGDAPGPLLEFLERERVEVLVLNGRPSFSAPLAPELVAELRRRFPEGETVGHFELRWR